MKTAPKMLLALACLSASAFTSGHKGPAVRKVTIYPLTNYFSYEAIPHTSVADSIEDSHSEYFSMTVTVSDDPDKTYSIDCLAYRFSLEIQFFLSGEVQENLSLFWVSQAQAAMASPAMSPTAPKQVGDQGLVSGRMVRELSHGGLVLAFPPA
jgi:hypothetical protein